MTKVLTDNEIAHEFFETKYFMHGWQLISEDIDLKNYSAVVAVGGDGTAHEIVNGMLSRKDKVKLPLCFVPNGSGNDFLRSFGVFSVDQALTALVKG